LLEGDAASVWRTQGIGLQRYLGTFADISEMTLSASIILKTPGPDGEKGVLYSSFEYNWMRITRSTRARQFFRDYYLVGASSWSPPDYASFAHLAGLSADPIFIGISNLADMEAYQLMAPVIEPLPLMACDWVNPDLYQPRERSAREIDILMVANWLPFKRHWLLFEALRHLPRNINVVLVGRDGEGRTETTIRDEARAFGVRQDLQLHTDIDIQEVMDMQCNARVGVLLSAREGSCVAPVECFFGDTPVGMMNDGHVGSRAYINAQTGVLFTRRGIGRELASFLERSDEFTPRNWAVEHVTCQRSSQRLNEHLKAHAQRRNQPWTTDIAPLCWRYMPQHIRRDDAERVRVTAAAFGERYGFALETPKARSSS
jgi:glycosyltransferase involved in cell wall biosynthesis